MPRLLFDLPELRYPARLNCAVELLTGPPDDRPVFRTASGDTWTYGGLRDRVDRIAHVLTGTLGVVPGNRVLLRGPTTPWLAACWLAVLKAGAVAVTVLAQQRPHELRAICEIARVRHALCDVRAVDDLAKAEIPGLGITTYGGDAPDDLRCRTTSGGVPGTPYAAVDTAADDVALIAFTSGTTGRPKGCRMHFHRDVLAIADTFSRHVLGPRPDDLFAGSPPLGLAAGPARNSWSRRHRPTCTCTPRDCWPDARFVFLLRHPESTARSWHETDPVRRPHETAVTDVLRYMTAVEEARRWAPTVRRRYEDITDDPEREMRRLCAHLGVDYARAMLHYGEKSGAELVRGLGDWRENIRTGSVQPGRALPGQDEIPERLRPLCAAWGYTS
ncbi:2-succinylbenzoate--CoA ligase [Streptomyces violaceorubidus]